MVPYSIPWNDLGYKVSSYSQSSSKTLIAVTISRLFQESKYKRIDLSIFMDSGFVLSSASEGFFDGELNHEKKFNCVELVKCLLLITPLRIDDLIFA